MSSPTHLQHDVFNSNQDITVTLWEEIATVKSRFNRAEIEAGVAPVILAMTGLKAKTYYGK
ncbi:hypothetical protein Hanom_Chr09g00798641 [Helianthus anomalus]